MKHIFFKFAVISMLLPAVSFFTACDKEELPPEEEQTDDDDQDDDSGSDTEIVRSVSLNVTDFEMTVGDEPYSLAATFEGDGTEDLAFEWTSSDPQVATVTVSDGTVSSATVNAVAEGTAVITISYKNEEEGIDLSASATVTVSVPFAHDGTLRILAIGNSFSQDAVEQYLYELFDAAGQEAVIGNMYIGGCSLDTHWENASGDKAAYDYRKVVDGVKNETSSQKLSDIIASEPWDYISLQQVSGESGKYDTYTHLPDMIDYVEGLATNPDMKIVLHQTWAYQSGSTHADFPDYDSDQMTMYNAIMQAVQQAVSDNPEIELVIPSGTAVQNGRTSYIGDAFCRDGYHLNVDYGRFTAACAWFEAIASDYESFAGNSDVTANAYKPEAVSDYYAEIAKAAAHAAAQEPYSVTTLTDYQTPEITSDGKTPMYIDFGSQAASDSPWINVSDPGVSESEIWLSDGNGDYTGASLAITKAFDEVHQSAGYEPDQDFELNGMTFPLSAWKDGLKVTGTKGEGDVGPAEIRISGLDEGKTYTFSIVAVRYNGSVSARQTEFTVTGVSTDTKTINQGLPQMGSVSEENQMSHFAEFTGVAPDVSGCVYISVKGIDTGSAAEGHINALVISPSN